MLFDYIPHMALAGLSIAILSNVVLLLGRKPEYSVLELLKSGHLNKDKREKRFSRRAIRIAVPMAYVGVGLFLLTVLIVVAEGLIQLNG